MFSRLLSSLFEAVFLGDIARLAAVARLLVFKACEREIRRDFRFDLFASNDECQAAITISLCDWLARDNRNKNPNATRLS